MYIHRSTYACTFTPFILTFDVQAEDLRFIRLAAKELQGRQRSWDAADKVRTY